MAIHENSNRMNTPQDIQAIFRAIDPDTWERQPYFDYYYHSIRCKYNLNATIDISPLLPRIREKGLKFFPVFLYVILRSVNENKQFRMGFDADGQLGYWEYVVPSYTIFHKDDQTFSDIWSEYKESFEDFYHVVCTDMQTYKDTKGIQGRPGRPDNFCPVSCVPWLSFTGFSQDTYCESSMLFPLIRFGKYFVQDGKTLLPLAVFVHHAVADGYHTCKLINEIQAYAASPQEWLES